MLDKSIISGKEHRKPYTKGKLVDRRCRNHGECSRCRNNRLHRHRKELARVLFEEQDSIDGVYACVTGEDECYIYASTILRCGHTCFLKRYEDRKRL